MLLIECLLLIVLPLVDLAVGNYVAGGEGAARAATARLAQASKVCGVTGGGVDEGRASSLGRPQPYAGVPKVRQL